MDKKNSVTSPPVGADKSPLTELAKVVSEPVKVVLQKTGFKVAQSRTHAILRIILLIGVVALMAMSIRTEKKKDDILERVDDIVEPGTALHKTVMDMSEENRYKYLKSLESIFQSEDDAKRRYLNGIKIALIAGVLTEYIINGNTNKPMNILSKTVIYNIIYSMATNKIV